LGVALSYAPNMTEALSDESPQMFRSHAIQVFGTGDLTAICHGVHNVGQAARNQTTTWGTS
jgi:hypothetical protein